MNPEIKADWIDRLRSGKYKQGSGHLHLIDHNDIDRFCCLGVLCEAAVENDVIPPPVKLGDEYLYDSHTGLLPISVGKWSGLNNTTTLIDMNDNGDSFDMIADFIEETL